MNRESVSIAWLYASHGLKWYAVLSVNVNRSEESHPDFSCDWAGNVAASQLRIMNMPT